MTATLVYRPDISDRMTGGDAGFFRLDGGTIEGHSVVFVSSAVAPFSGPETYIFAAEADSGGPDPYCVTDWGELEGSCKGDKSINDVLSGLGFEVKWEADK